VRVRRRIRRRLRLLGDEILIFMNIEEIHSKRASNFMLAQGIYSFLINREKWLSVLHLERASKSKVSYTIQKQILLQNVLWIGR
jgi:hypothetical protein